MNEETQVAGILMSDADEEEVGSIVIEQADGPQVA
jgi:hypothetical protein